MTIQEFYTAIGGSYDDILGRFLAEDRIIKFVKLFKTDPTYNQLLESIKNKDIDEAFRAIHTLKGISLNLSFDKLTKASSDLTEIFRHYNNEDYQKELDNVKKEYNNIIKNIDLL